MPKDENQKAIDALLARLNHIGSDEWWRSFGSDGAGRSTPSLHWEADIALLAFFQAIGRHDVVEAYNKIEPKWYE